MLGSADGNEFVRYRSKTIFQLKIFVSDHTCTNVRISINTDLSLAVINNALVLHNILVGQDKTSCKLNCNKNSRSSMSIS